VNVPFASDIVNDKTWKCPCPLLSVDNPKWKENRQELYNSLYPVHTGIATEIWWWTDGFQMESWYPKYYRILLMPLEELPRLLGSEDKVIQVIIEWRLKHGQDI